MIESGLLFGCTKTIFAPITLYLVLDLMPLNGEELFYFIIGYILGTRVSSYTSTPS
jgi:hypothetical protein